MNYLTLYQPGKETVTYRLADDYDQAVALVAAAKDHAGFPVHVAADSPYRAQLVHLDGRILDVDLSTSDGAEYAERELAAAEQAAKDGAKLQAASAIGQLQPEALREVLAEYAERLS